jgi:hypothetical protein
MSTLFILGLVDSLPSYTFTGYDDVVVRVLKDRKRKRRERDELRMKDVFHED